MQHTSGAESHAASRPRNQHSRNLTGLGNCTRYRNLDDTSVTDGVISVTDTDVTRMMKTCMRTGLLRRSSSTGFEHTYCSVLENNLSV